MPSPHERTEPFLAINDRSSQEKRRASQIRFHPLLIKAFAERRIDETLVALEDRHELLRMDLRRISSTDEALPIPQTTKASEEPTQDDPFAIYRLPLKTLHPSLVDTQLRVTLTTNNPELNGIMSKFYQERIEGLQKILTLGNIDPDSVIGQALATASFLSAATYFTKRTARDINIEDIPTAAESIKNVRKGQSLIQTGTNVLKQLAAMYGWEDKDIQLFYDITTGKDALYNDTNESALKPILESIKNAEFDDAIKMRDFLRTHMGSRIFHSWSFSGDNKETVESFDALARRINSGSIPIEEVPVEYRGIQPTSSETVHINLAFILKESVAMSKEVFIQIANAFDLPANTFPIQLGNTIVTGIKTTVDHRNRTRQVVEKMDAKTNETSEDNTGNFLYTLLETAHRFGQFDRVSDAIIRAYFMTKQGEPKISLKQYIKAMLQPLNKASVEERVNKQQFTTRILARAENFDPSTPQS